MRRSKDSPTSKRTITLPDDIWDYIDSRDICPVRDKPRYGSLTIYLEKLVRQDIQRVEGVSSLATPSVTLSSLTPIEE